MGQPGRAWPRAGRKMSLRDPDSRASFACIFTLDSVTITHYYDPLAEVWTLSAPTLCARFRSSTHIGYLYAQPPLNDILSIPLPRPDSTLASVGRAMLLKLMRIPSHRWPDPSRDVTRRLLLQHNISIVPYVINPVPRGIPVEVSCIRIIYARLYMPWKMYCSNT